MSPDVSIGFLATIFTMLLLLSSIVTTVGETVYDIADTLWIQYSNSSPTSYATSTCVSGNYLYVIGYPAVIEKRSVYNGSLISSWNGSSYSESLLLSDCTVAGDKLIVVGVEGSNWYAGRWIILGFDLDLNLMESYLGNYKPPSGASSVTYDGRYVYISGFGSDPGGEEWVVEKRDPSALGVVLATYNANPSIDGVMSDLPRAIGVNPVTRDIWVVGSMGFNNSSDMLWIEILSANLTRISSINSTSYYGATGIVFDEDGYAYITLGYSGAVLKIDMYGDVVGSLKLDFSPAIKIAYARELIYVFGTNELYGERKQYLQVLDKNLNTVAFKSLMQGGFLFIGKASSDSDRVYIAGYVIEPEVNSYSWIIYSFSTGGRAYYTVTATTTKTTTTTVTIPSPTTVTTTKTESYTYTVTTTLTERRTIYYPFSVPYVITSTTSIIVTTTETITIKGVNNTRTYILQEPIVDVPLAILLLVLGLAIGFLTRYIKPGGSGPM
ncbi:MAG: hypothetical protein ACP5N5_06815 [Desulfurococcus sp.]|uniref:hypothetical protein n=1 Tax=Desulfurococcus sp. TaxID=51678 RepID=UPI003D0D9ECD